MERQPLTIYQKLTKTFGFMGSKQTPPAFEFDKEELLRTDSKTDFQKAKLQAQQTQYIADKWSKLDMSLYNQSVYYEPNRISAYYDYESMEFSISELTKISTPNGFISIKELADKGRDYEFIVYSYDHNLKKIVPAKGRNAHYTRDEMTYKITFDDNSYIIATYGHRFLKRDGVYCKVEDLKEGDSMMPFYRKSFYNNDNYNWIYSCNSNEGHHGWVTEHDLIAEWFYNRKKEEGEEVHHKDFNGKNNLPENLKIMNINEHRSYHAKIHNKKMWTNPEYRSKMMEVAKSRKNKHHWNGIRSGKNNPAYFHLPWDNIIDTAKKYRTLSLTAQALGVSPPKLKNDIKSNGYNNWFTFLTAYGIEKQKNAYYKVEKRKNDIELVNHKIFSIEPYGVVPVYDLTVPGYKNFATDTIFSHNTPEVSAALDIYAEESTTKSEKGQILSIHSDSKRIKHILDDLFYNVLDINTNIQMWTRGMCKYGDNFVYLKIDPEKGIIGCQQLPNIEVQRLEGARQSTPNQSDVSSKFPSRELRFTWMNKNMEFQAWEIAHFRILGDDRKLPYGTSMLDKIRRIWKQLLLAEDAMLVYRTSRAPERRVFKIFVGNMDDKDIEPYVQRIANKFKRDQVVDQKNGQVDMRYNQMPVWKNSPIPLLDGRTITIEELAKEYDEGKENWVYSVQDKTLQIVPGKVKWCGKNYTADKLIKVWLDDDTWIMTAPEHPFLLRDGSHKPAEDLKPGDSLMPYYTKKSEGIIKGYETIYNPKSGKYEYTHQIVSNEKYDNEYVNSKNKRVIHHQNFNKLDNCPENLVEMDRHDHWVLHYQHTSKTLNSPENLAKNRERLIEYNKSERKINQNKKLSKEQLWHLRFVPYNHSELHTAHNEIRKNAQLRDWNEPGKKQYRSEKMRVNIDDYTFMLVNQNILTGRIINRKTMLEYLSKDMIDHLLSINNNKRLHNLKKIERTVLEREVNNRGFNSISEYISSIKLNHKVSRIEEIFQNDDVYCMTVVGPNDENDRHNFAIKSFHIDRTISISGSFTSNSVDQDYFIPVRDISQSSPIETLPGAQNLGEIADIEYIQKKMLAALRIPKAFLGFEDVIGNGKGLALLDIRFARTINRIQQSIIQELNKIALIQLFLLGLEDELNNFTLMLTNPSGQSDLLKIEQWKEKITMYKDATSDQSQMGILPVSHTWAKKNILGFSDNEVILDLQQQRMERAIGFELTNTQLIIKRTHIFDDVDKKYGISEDERKKIEAAGTTAQPGEAPGGGGGGGGSSSMPEIAAPGAPSSVPGPTGNEAGAPAGSAPAGGEAPLSESRKEKILSMLGEDTTLEDLFDGKKAKENIYQIEQVIKDILNE